MRKTSFPRLMIMIGIAGAVAVAPAAAQAQLTNEPPVNVRQSARYEDDAWYDVSEWFDGNDYNPTDEAIGRWDSEYYSYYDNLTSDDQDNDPNVASANNSFDGGYRGYGYSDNNANANEDFVYDYYDDRYADYSNNNDGQNYESFTDYIDADADGVYDYYFVYTDTDGDGQYDKMTDKRFFGGNQQGNNQQANARTNDQQQANVRTDNQQASAQTDRVKKQTMQRSSRMVTVSGQVQSVKEVQTPSGARLVAQMPGQQGQQPLAVDLGPIGIIANAADKQPAQGDQLQARGPLVTIGEKNVLLAQTVTMNGKDVPIHRYGRDYTGTIESTKTANLRGKQHRVVTMRTQDGKRLTVDLGAVDQLKLGQNQLQANQQIRVSGPAVKVQDRPLLVARQVSIDGQTMEVRPEFGQMNNQRGNQQQMQNRNQQNRNQQNRNQQNRNQQGQNQQGQSQNQTRQGERNANPQDETNGSQQGQNQNQQNRNQNSGQQGSNE